MQQTGLFSDAGSPASALTPSLRRRELPVAVPITTLGDQKDIRYYGKDARVVLNDPESTGMGYWSINPYIGCAFGCTYCYARYAHRYAVERATTALEPGDAVREDFALIPAWLAFERRVFVKRNAAAVLEKSLRPGSERLRALAGGETVVIGTATDPYQPAERQFRVTRSILEVLAERRRLSIVIITKSPLVTRDVDVLARIAQRSSLTVHLSLITLDRELARRLEPRAPTPEARVRALARLREANIDVGINVMPILPGITDRPSDLEALVQRVAGAGATHLNACALRLRSSARERYLPFIAAEFPHLYERYRTAYADGHHVSERYRDGLRQVVKRLCARAGIAFGMPDDDDGERAGVAWSATVDDTAPPQMELGL